MKHVTAITLLLVAACSSTAKGTPQEAADQISAHLVAGERAEADNVFERVEKSETHRDAVYNVVYGQAGVHYDGQDYATSVRMLRFLADHYRDARAVREALLYALLQQNRAGSAKRLEGDQIKEMEALIKDLREGEAEPPVLLDLIDAQVAIDRNQVQRARASLSRFRSRWNGSPPALRTYVVELQRYIDSHGG